MATLFRAVAVIVQLMLYCSCAWADTAVFTVRDDHSEIPQLRQWLWKHWYRQTSGTARLRWLTIEGDAGTSDYSISRDVTGTWALSIHLVGSDRFAEKNRPVARDERTIAYSVQRVEPLTVMSGPENV